MRSSLLDLGFQNLDTFFFYCFIGNHTTISLIYVNDIIIIGNDEGHVCSLIQLLDKKFSPKDLGNLHLFLDVEVKRNSDVLYLSPLKYINQLLSKASLDSSKPCKANGSILSKYDGHCLDDPTRYKCLVGALQHCVLTS